jgi:acyl-CoA thioesterase
MEAIQQMMDKDRFGRGAGIELVAVGEGRATARMQLGPQHWHGHNLAHGGAIFALADFAFAAASNSYGTVAVAINASITFVKAATTGTLTR